ncbi:hypothetical protein C8J57DRAFT_529306 [Mycena rebaudengoi]|nr:hypothetical protein C8J57DRAFT_529306 [Mycena rebaudengoi]
MPRCSVKYENGDEWDKDNKSYSSYNFAYEARNIPLGGDPHPTEVKVGMGINLRPAGSEAPLPQISFINRNQVLIWVSDPTLKARRRGIVVMMSSYVDNIRTEPKLSIYEQGEIELGARSLNVGNLSKFETEENEPGTISVRAAQVEKQGETAFKKNRGWLPSFLAKLGRCFFANLGQRSSGGNITEIPPYEYLARGWDTRNNEWRKVLWPALDKDCLPAQPTTKPCVWKTRCPWEVQPGQTANGNGDRNV